MLAQCFQVSRTSWLLYGGYSVGMYWDLPDFSNPRQVRS